MQTTEPFSRGQIVVSEYTAPGGVIREGEQYRVVECSECDDCESGWLVSVAKVERGPMPRKAAICGTVDSHWFKAR